jgi:hypothetical protein
METVGEPFVRVLSLKFACPSCGRKFATKPDLAGKKIRCNSCGAGVRVPQGDQIIVGKSPRSRADGSGGPDRSMSSSRPDRASSPGAEMRARAEGDGVSTRSRRSNREPLDPAELHARSDEVVARHDEEQFDSAPMDVDLTKVRESRRRNRMETVLPSRAELMEQVRQEAAEQQVQEPKPRGPQAQKKKKRKKASGFFDPKETLKLVAGVGAFVGVLAFLAWGYPEFRFPLGGLLCVIGFITYLLGSVSIRQVVAEEGVLKVLVYRFCPPYQWWFVATHWDETKDFVAFFVAGLIVMSIGSGIIKTSATGRRAEASDKAYQKAARDRQSTVPPVSLKGIVGDNGDRADD